MIRLRAIELVSLLLLKTEQLVSHLFHKHGIVLFSGTKSLLLTLQNALKHMIMMSKTCDLKLPLRTIGNLFEIKYLKTM